MLKPAKMISDLRIDLFIAFALRLQYKDAMMKIPVIVKNRFSTRSV